MAMQQLVDHPERDTILAEVHARPIEIVGVPVRVRRLVFVVPPRAGAMAGYRAAFGRFLAELGGEAVDDSRSQYSFAAGPYAVTWEFHTEFVTITWRGSLGDRQNFPDGIGIAVLEGTLLIGASRIDVIEGSEVPQRLLPGFQLASLCVAGVENGGGQIATDFVTDADRFTRFEFAAGALSPLRRSILVRRILEIETYRTMALLGLPLARRHSATLSGIEIELGNVVERLSDATTIEAAQQELTALHALSVRSGQLSEQLDYRFAASRAYGDVLAARLEGLKEQPSPHGSTLTRYVGNRIDPALATCAAMQTRLGRLSEKLERAIGLLNLRIGLDLQVQNRAVLETIARTGQSQFRLQRTVEGLSVIAISYYLLGIAGYALGGPMESLHLEKALVLSLVTPVLVLLVWLSVRAVRKMHS